MNNTSIEYDEIINSAKDIFIKKSADYGTSWRVLRPISVVDQIYIKARRIRMIQDGVQKINEGVASEFAGIINYAVIGLIQIDLEQKGDTNESLDVDTVREAYEAKVSVTKSLMLDKNHDYGEAWRNMSQESFADLILMKLHRMKQIIKNDGKTIISEGLDANYMDILNYAVFALIMQKAK